MASRVVEGHAEDGWLVLVRQTLMRTEEALQGQLLAERSGQITPEQFKEIKDVRIVFVPLTTAAMRDDVVHKVLACAAVVVCAVPPGDGVL